MSFLKRAPCYLIAEIGVNHGGDVELAKKMIRAAKESGADAVKFQTFTAESLVSKGTPKVKYQEETTNRNETHYDMIKSLEFRREDHGPVIDYCSQLAIDFISTPYDVESAKFLHELGVSIFKTASADIVDLALHQFLAETKKTVIISTGMSTLGEVETALEIYKKAGNEDVILLHCVSNYPCSTASLNLRAMNTLKHAFGVDVGYSDHAEGFVPAVVAVSLGAKAIEKHFTLDKNAPGPDHKASSTPAEFTALSEAVRCAESSLGSPIKRIQEEERQMRQVSRKSLFVAHRIPKGEVITESLLTLKRPGTGIYADQIDRIVGRRATRNLVMGEQLGYGDFA